MIDDKDRGQWTSASSAQADALCQGRHLAQRGLPDEGSKDATTGDRIHQAWATGAEADLTAEEETTLEAVKEIERNLIVKYFGPEFANAKATPIVEKRFWCAWPDGLKHSAQLDCVYRYQTKALIIDGKMLFGDVAESPQNLQLRDQVCCYEANTPLLEEVAVAIAQPRVTRDPVLCIYKRADIIKARELMYHRVNSSNKEGMPRTAGEAQCKWCKAKSRCPEYQKWSTSMVKLEPSLVDIPVMDWTPAQRKQFCDSFDVAQKWLDNAWLAMERLAAADPNAIPGYHLVDGSPRSTIRNLQSVYDRFSKEGGSLEQFMAHATITKKDLTELTRTATKLKGKKLESKVEDIIANDFILSPVKKSLKPIENK